jgi:tetratricopeptide (TPR) repeat protein
VITGSGGFGKTQLAVEAVWRYGRFFAGGVFWLSFEDGAGIAGEIAACGTLLGLHPGYAGLSLDEQVRLVLERWHDGRPRLVVLDNCEDESLLRLWLPRIGVHSILVTSRSASWSGDLGLTALKLATLPRHESVQLLRRHRDDLAPDDPDLDSIAEELGDLPLALHLAGGYLRRYAGITAGRPAAYLAVLRRPGLLDIVSLTDGKTPTGHDAHVARTFAASTSRLDPSDAVDGLALRALVYAACLAPGEAIPRWLLAQVLGMDWDDEAVQVALTDALCRLGDLGLVEGAEGDPSLHRLIAAFARTLDQDAAATLDAVELAVGQAAKAQNNTGLPLPLLAWRGHLRWVAERAADRGGDIAGGLLSALDFHLDMIGDYAGAKLVSERALAIAEAKYGPDHPNVAIRLNNLASVQWKLGDPVAAKPLYERALRIGEAAYGPDDPKVATCLNNLGTVLRALGDPAAAKPLFERALRIDEAAYGPDHSEVATCLNNLGGALRALGDPAAAKTLYERALRIDEAALGPDHPEVATCLNNLGVVLRGLGDREGARAAQERALAICIRSLGPDHPDTRQSRENLAFLERGAGPG